MAVFVHPGRSRDIRVALRRGPLFWGSHGRIWTRTPSLAGPFAAQPSLACPAPGLCPRLDDPGPCPGAPSPKGSPMAFGMVPSASGHAIGLQWHRYPDLGGAKGSNPVPVDAWNWWRPLPVGGVRAPLETPTPLNQTGHPQGGPFESHKRFRPSCHDPDAPWWPVPSSRGAHDGCESYSACCGHRSSRIP